jgi:hypothetical protein
VRVKHSGGSVVEVMVLLVVVDDIVVLLVAVVLVVADVVTTGQSAVSEAVMLFGSPFASTEPTISQVTEALLQIVPSVGEVKLPVAVAMSPPLSVAMDDGLGIADVAFAGTTVHCVTGSAGNHCR